MNHWQKLSFILGLSIILGVAAQAQNSRTVAPETRNESELVFRVKWDGRIIPGITEVSELKRKTEVITSRSGADVNLQHRSPGATSYAPIILRRPRTFDKAFERWANKVWNRNGSIGAEVSLKDFRKDITIELCDENGRVLLAFHVYRCWPSEYIAISKQKVGDDSLAMETLVLEHEGWERDYDIR